MQVPRRYGSVFQRVWPPALLSLLITLFLKLDQRHRWLGDYFVLELAYGRDAYQTLNVVVGFLVIFRTQLSHMRYWEARTNVQRMTAAWSSAFMHSCSFACGVPFRNKKKCFLAAAENEDTLRRVQQCMFFNDVIHLASLLHAVSCAELRSDHVLDNLRVFRRDDPSVNPPADDAEVDPELFEPINGAWYSLQRTIESCVPASLAKQQRYNHVLPFGVIGGFSDVEKEALANVEDRPFVVQSWLTSVIARRYRSETFVDPPITSRIFQELSDGHRAFMDAQKVAQTPFPFPLAQMANIILIVFSFCTVPVLFSSAIVSTAWASVLSAACTAVFYGLSEVFLVMSECQHASLFMHLWLHLSFSRFFSSCVRVCVCVQARAYEYMQIFLCYPRAQNVHIRAPRLRENWKIRSKAHRTNCPYRTCTGD